MSINKSTIINIEHITSLFEADYEFNRFSEADLAGDVSILRLSAITKPHSNWTNIGCDMWEAMLAEMKFSGASLYCFIHSPWWTKDNKISRFYALDKAFQKDYAASSLNLEKEMEITENNMLSYFGVAKVTKDNFRLVSQILSDHENGILFTFSEINDAKLAILVHALRKTIQTDKNSLICRTNVVEAINVIVENRERALYPYAWEETGSYHLDIFSKRELGK